MVKIVEILLFPKALKWSWDIKQINVRRVQKLNRKHKLLRDCPEHIGVEPDIILRIKSII